METAKMKVVAVQTDIVWENKSANFDKVRSLLAAGMIEPGSLVILPETFATGFNMNIQAVAETGDREAEKFLAATARSLEVYLLGGLVTLAPDGKGRNEAVLLDPEGSQVVRYTKIHPFSYAGESEHFTGGEKIVTFSWGGFCVAPFICYDLRFPEIFRLAVRQGATMFIVIANWPKAREYHWRTLLAARAIENQAYAVGVNRCGKDPKVTYSGDTLIIDPRGQVIVDAGDKERIVQTELDLHCLLSYRRDFPALQDIHPEFFRQ
jgi:omega-amidase